MFCIYTCLVSCGQDSYHYAMHMVTTPYHHGNQKWQKVEITVLHYKFSMEGSNLQQLMHISSKLLSTFNYKTDGVDKHFQSFLKSPESNVRHKHTIYIIYIYIYIIYYIISKKYIHDY